MFQSPCGDFLLPDSAVASFRKRAFQSPCGDFLLPDLAYVIGILVFVTDRFNPLAGIFYCLTIAWIVSLLYFFVSIPLRGFFIA